MRANYLDRKSVIPLYYQLASLLREQITHGEYLPGQAFSSENELMNIYNVSRNTVRQAFVSLEGLGLIRREQGRGTFVTSSRVLSKPGVLSSFSEEVQRMGSNPGAQLLRVGEVEAPLKVLEELRIEPGSHILNVQRLRTADGEPIGVAESWFNTVRFPELASLDYGQVSLYSMFENVLEQIILRATQQLFADAANKDEAVLLGIDAGAPVMRFLRTTFVSTDDSGGTPIEYVQAAFIGSKYSLETELFRSGAR